jgi:hypothetical protein
MYIQSQVEGIQDLRAAMMFTCYIPPKEVSRATT